MRIRRNPVLGTWEMAESESAPWQSVSRRPGLVAREANSLLIVDDEEMVRTVFQRIFASGCPDFQINTAANGREGLDLFCKSHHGSVIMDLHMPVMDGEAAFWAIQKYCNDNNWEMPSIIFCTGYNPPQGIRKVVAEDPIHCMLQKPVTAKTLIDAVTARL